MRKTKGTSHLCTTHKHICIALLQRVDKRTSEEFRLKPFTEKASFLHFAEHQSDKLFSDEVFVIYSGGSHQIISLATAKKMDWVR